MRSMHITIVQGAFLPVPPLFGGAVEKRWFALGQAFADQGHSVTHISRKVDELPWTEQIQGVRYLRVKGYVTPRSLTVLKWLDLLYTLRVMRVLPNADIVVSNTFFLPIFLRSRGKGVLYVDMARMPKGQIRFYGRAARLRANSSAVAEAMVRECPRAKERVKVIPNPLPFVPDEVTGEEKERVILYAGRLHAEKGLRLLLEAVRLLNGQGALGDWRIEIAGPHETALGGSGEDYLRKLEALAEGLPVRWHGMVRDSEELNAIYRRAMVFAYPSLAEKGETFGLAVLEAMAWGCVPVVSDLTCFRDFVRDNENGCVFPHRDPDAAGKLAECLSRLIRQSDERSALQAQALGVRETHSLDSVAHQFLNDFESLRGSIER